MTNFPTFLTDAYATVGVAYHRAAGVYTMDKEMQELGTAAVHRLTMATSYTNAQKNEDLSLMVARSGRQLWRAGRISEGSTGQVAGRKTPE